MSALRQALLEFRAKLDNISRQRRRENISRSKERDGKPATQARVEPGEGLKGFVSSPDVLGLLGLVRKALERDQLAYQQALPGGIEAAAAGEPPRSGGGPAPVSAYVSPAFSQALAQHLVPLFPEPVSPEDALQLPPNAQYFVRLLDSELAAMIDESALLSRMGTVSVPRLKKAREAFLNQRYGDVITILKSALRTEPHNNVILFIKCQFLYFLAGLGQQDAVPEARDLAQKAMIANERIPADRLLLYRYHCIIAESVHDHERALSWMREHNMLQVGAMQQEEGLTALGGIPLKMWALLANVPGALWNDNEFNALKALTLGVVGGGAVYINMLRNTVIDTALARKDPIAPIEEIETTLHQAHGFYSEISPAWDKLPVRTSERPWLVRIRYLNKLSEAAPRPKFDQVLLNISLGGEAWRSNCYPENEVQAAMGEVSLSYWRLWAQSLTPVQDIHHANLLPTMEALEDGEMLADCDGMLIKLRQAEEERIKPQVWEEIKPWMVRWRLDHLLAAGTGSNRPRDRFALHGSPLYVFSERWNNPNPQAVLASDIILELSQRGAFGSLAEVLAACEGAYRLLDDPTHGLVATQKRALRAAQEQNPTKLKGLQIDDGGMSGQQILTLLLPVGLVGGMAAIIMLSQNMGQTIGLTLALGGFAGVAMLILAKKK